MDEQDAPREGESEQVAEAERARLDAEAEAATKTFGGLSAEDRLRMREQFGALRPGVPRDFA